MWKVYSSSALSSFLYHRRKSGAGKSALINAVFGSDVTVNDVSFHLYIYSHLCKPVSDKVAGDHDIEKELTLASNDRIIIHDSKGFEGGEEKNLQKVFDFIDRRSKMPALKDQIHAIWYDGRIVAPFYLSPSITRICAEIPFAGSRLFEKGVERLLQEFRWDGSSSTLQLVPFLPHDSSSNHCGIHKA